MAGTFLVILACFLWGMDTLIRYPLVESGIPPVTIVFFEHILLTTFFSLRLLPAIKRIGELKLADVFSFIVIGGLGSAVATVAFTEAFEILNPSLVILLQKLQPLVAITLSALILKEEIQKQFLLWAFICMVGGLLISWPDIIRFHSLITSNYDTFTTDAALRGYGMVGLSILGWGAATVFGKRLSMVGFDTRSIMGGRFFIGLLVLLPFAWNMPMTLPLNEDYIRILIMVLISGALAMWLYYKGLQRLSARTTAIAEMFFPFFAIVVNWIFLGKQLNDWQLLGGGILIIGSLIIQIKKY